jgi:hypothetical protein
VRRQSAVTISASGIEPRDPVRDHLVHGAGAGRVEGRGALVEEHLPLMPTPAAKVPWLEISAPSAASRM